MYEILTILVIVAYLVTGLNAEQCYTSSGGVYSAGDIYRNLQYCAFGCCGPALNRYCCPMVGPIVGICIGAIAFIVILIIIIVCCRKYSERQIRRRAQMKMYIGPTLSSRYDPPVDDAESNHASSRQDYQVKSQTGHHTTSHRSYNDRGDDIDYRPHRNRDSVEPRGTRDSHRGESGSSRRKESHRHGSRREYHSDDDRLSGHRGSHRERHRYRDDRERERRHSRSRERYMDHSYDDIDFSDDERSYRHSSRRSRYSDPPPYRERVRDYDNYDRSSHRRSRSRDRSYYDR